MLPKNNKRIFLLVKDAFNETVHVNNIQLLLNLKMGDFDSEKS